MSSPPATVDLIQRLVTSFTTFSQSLPSSVPLAQPDDEIFRVMTEVQGDGVWSTFNRRFDILSMEHNRDDDGKLRNMRRGQYGLDAVAKYLSSISWSQDMPLDLVRDKIRRVFDAMRYLIVQHHDQLSADTVFQPNSASRLKSSTDPLPINNSSLPSAPSAPEPSAQPAVEAKTQTVTSAPLKPSTKKRPKATRDLETILDNRALPEDDDNDGTYHARKPIVTVNGQRRAPSESPVRSYSVGSNGLDIDMDSDDDMSVSASAPGRKRHRVVLSEDDNASSGDEGAFSKHKPVRRHQRKKKRTASSPVDPTQNLKTREVIDISDGETDQRNKRGPANNSRPHFQEPVKTKTGGKLRWSFKCKHAGCNIKITVARCLTAENAIFDDEPKKPSLGNLATHIRNAHPGAAAPADTPNAAAAAAADADIMTRFLLNGKEKLETSTSHLRVRLAIRDMSTHIKNSSAQTRVGLDSR
ncbi:hypothetical protein BDZ89DRAFT_625134 [Hymenopellis radicata]|nr:hypothetical protein BDZ89DRAFT_625134 [Hymenopellis radicata]